MSADVEAVPSPDPAWRLPSFAPVAARNVALHVDRSAQRALRKGHPWLYSDGVQKQSHDGATGDLAVVFDQNRKFLAIGLYDAESPIRVRVLHSGKSRHIDAEFFAERLRLLVESRRGLLATGTDGYRLVNGENEGMPGLVVDRYAETLVVKLYTPAWFPHLPVVLPQLLAAQPADRIVLRLARETAARAAEHDLPGGQVVYGSELTEAVWFRENRLWFECDPIRGQKTGFFLDQRENRQRVEGWSGGCQVLNVFSFSGGFSLYAARGGARRVISLDTDARALAAAERNFARNQGDPNVADAVHETVRADAFAQLAAYADSGAQFDLVVIDPPAFAHKRSQCALALRSYSRLAQRALPLLRRGGRLVFASCSAPIASADFFETVSQAALRGGRPLRNVNTSAHASDHPVGFAGGAYLKCLWGTVG